MLSFKAFLVMPLSGSLWHANCLPRGANTESARSIEEPQGSFSMCHAKGFIGEGAVLK
jgi:hypothetical protein